VLGSIAFIGCVLWFWGGSNGELDTGLPDYRSFSRCMRDSSFQVVCLVTSTGFGTADFDRWPESCRMLLMLLATMGACAGSTGGGIKVVRVLIVARAAILGVLRFVRPRAIHAVRVDGQTLDQATVANVTGYFALWILVFLLGTLCLTTFGIDLVTSSTAVLATLNNVGPGLGGVGPALSFEEMPTLVKALLSLYMILGRLEFYAVVALFMPGFWRH
jgi:trk system potassium uptake protein TrkH